VSRAPGSDVGRALLLGPEDEPTDFDFKWYTRNLSGSNDATLDGEAVEDADDLVRGVRAMVRESSIVEVSWRGETRLGFLRMIDPVEGFTGEYEVGLEIEWLKLKAFERRQPAIASSKASASNDATGAYDDVNSDWTDTVRSLVRPTTTAASTVRAIEDAAEEVNDSMRRAGAAGFELARGRPDVEKVARAMSAAFVNIGDAASAFASASDLAGADMAQTDEPRGVILALSFRAKAARDALALRRRAYLEAYRLAEATDPTILGIHTAKEGEDLRIVVLLWGYGTADAWRDVARLNRLSSPILEAGQRIRMPKLGATI
jgi:hypothetical protein